MSTGAHGPIDVDLDRDDDLDIRADVRGDLHVHPGVQVRIKGSFDGTITVDHDAYLVIGGDCGGRILRNDGRIVLAGTVRLPLDEVSGSVSVIVGSVIVDPRTGKASRLGREGRLKPVRRSNPAPQLAPDGEMYAYDARSRRFFGFFMEQETAG